MKRTLRAALLAGLITSIFAPSTPAHADLNTGLLAHYPFDGNANDASGNGRNGTVHSINWGQGHNEQACVFDGVNSWIDVTGINLANQSMSFAAWVRREAVSSTRNTYYVGLGDPGQMRICIGFRFNDWFTFSLSGGADLNTQPTTKWR
jgi:hypothetical protein